MADMNITFDGGGAHITLAGSYRGVSWPQAIITSDEIDGLDSTPTAKVSLTERQTANGARDVTDGEVVYSARTVTIPFAILARQDDGQVSLLRDMRDEIARLAGHMVRMTVTDHGLGTFLTGYVTVKWSGKDYQTFDTGEITMVCPDPVRYSVDETSHTLFPTMSGSAGTGLFYLNQTTLYYPISYSDPDAQTASYEAQQNIATASNRGSIASYPVLEASGGMTSGVRVDWMASDGAYGTLDWQGQPGAQPTIFDCKTHTVSIGGLDQTSLLTRRGFPHIPAHGSCRFILQSAGSGWVTVKTRDTWI